MNFLKIITFLFFLFYFVGARADFELLDTCKNEHKTKIEKCLEAIEKWQHIEDFACPLATISKDFVVMQVIMDNEFRKIDKEADDYLSAIEEGKEQFKTKNINLTILEEWNYIFDVFWKWGYFWKKYNQVCSSSWESSVWIQSLECINSIKPESISFFTPSQPWTTSACLALAEFKLDAYEKTALHLLWIAKKQLSWDEFQAYKKEQKPKYERVSKIITINLRLIDNLRNKWNDVTNIIFWNN